MLLCHLNLFLHPVLVHLIIEYVLVRVFHLLLVQFLLFNLLLRKSFPLFFSLAIELLDSLFFLLLAHGEVIHVLLVDMRLFVQCGTLRCQIPLLIRVPWIILELGHRSQITP